MFDSCHCITQHGYHAGIANANFSRAAQSAAESLNNLCYKFKWANKSLNINSPRPKRMRLLQLHHYFFAGKKANIELINNVRSIKYVITVVSRRFVQIFQTQPNSETSSKRRHYLHKQRTVLFLGRSTVCCSFSISEKFIVKRIKWKYRKLSSYRENQIFLCKATYSNIALEFAKLSSQMYLLFCWVS